MISLYASAFAGHADSLLPGRSTVLVDHFLLSGVTISVALLNVTRANVAGRAEVWIVAFKMLILAFVIGTGFSDAHWSRLGPSQWADPLATVGSGMVIFVAYEEFELIANSAEDVCDPGRTLPRALYLSVGIVISTYVLVAVVTVGALSFPAARAARDHVLATAARPALEGVGFVLVAVTALSSTTSGINATLYGTARARGQSRERGILNHLHCGQRSGRLARSANQSSCDRSRRRRCLHGNAGGTAFRKGQQVCRRRRHRGRSCRRLPHN
jgi:amino acid transporter